MCPNCVLEEHTPGQKMMSALESRTASATHIVAFLVEESFLVLTDRSVAQNAPTEAGKMLWVVRGIFYSYSRTEVEVGWHKRLFFVFQWKEVMPPV